nr:structural maintenance of chromosomes protein 4 [Tanacetum cinerariifolium]
ITKDQVDPQKLQDTLGDEFIAKCYDLKTMLERVALLEAQMEKMNPNLNSISDIQIQHSRGGANIGNERTRPTRQENITINGERKGKFCVFWMLEEFMGGFNIISLKLKEVYQMITLGGDAEL